MPVRTPGNQFIYSHFPAFVGSYGSYTGPVGQSPETSQGYFGPFPLLYIRFQSQKCLAVVPADVDPFDYGIVSIVPDTLVTGEIGKTIAVSSAGYLLGWRYRRMAGQSSPTTWTVWKWTWRYWSETNGSVKPFADAVLAQVTETFDGEGEFRSSPDPDYMDTFGRAGPSTVVISAGGTIRSTPPPRGLQPTSTQVLVGTTTTSGTLTGTRRPVSSRRTTFPGRATPTTGPGRCRRSCSGPTFPPGRRRTSTVRQRRRPRR